MGALAFARCSLLLQAQQTMQIRLFLGVILALLVAMAVGLPVPFPEAASEEAAETLLLQRDPFDGASRTCLEWDSNGECMAREQHSDTDGSGIQLGLGLTKEIKVIDNQELF